jgi:phosphatidylglycerol:prolipoprotein diacylglycerol transferase
MKPDLLEPLPIYFTMWALAAIVCIAAGAIIGSRSGFPPLRSGVAVALASLAILLGSKLLYLAEARFYPLDDYVPQEFRSLQHGFRIPGGMLLLALTLPLICRSLRLDWRRWGDSAIPLAALAIVFIRTGCFLNGCCFGNRCDLPWAVSFPQGSWAFWYQESRNWVPPFASQSLPIHPLQLYFLLAALLALVVLLWQHRHSPYPGYVQALWYLMFFGSTALLEPLRQNHLTLNGYLAPTAALAAAVIIYLGPKGTRSVDQSPFRG